MTGSDFIKSFQRRKNTPPCVTFIFRDASGLVRGEYDPHLGDDAWAGDSDILNREIACWYISWDQQDADVVQFWITVKDVCMPVNSRRDMDNLSALTYKGYHAAINRDEEDHLLVGNVVGVEDILGFHGRDKEELKENFKNCIDDYIEIRTKYGKKPAESSILVEHELIEDDEDGLCHDGEIDWGPDVGGEIIQ